MTDLRDNQSMRRTKILATIGPASESKEVLGDMMRAGLNAVRCNFSHGTADDHQKRVSLVREVAADLGKRIGILADLQGPKIRIGAFIDDEITLNDGDTFILDANMAEDQGTQVAVGLAYKSLPHEVSTNDRLLLDDGRLILQVKSVEKDSQVVCEVIVGGVLKNAKGINKEGGGLSAPALTDKDRADIITAAGLGVDYVAVSFPRDAKDIELARSLVQKAGSKAGIVAKIERIEAVGNIDEIIKASDAVMVARGDLAVEIGDENVPGVQKKIIERARALDCVVITATQMMESMITSPSPTRAEVSDVANAVLDGTDAVMLSAESATGAYPVKAIEVMDKICLSAEQHEIKSLRSSDKSSCFARVDEAIAMSSIYVANHLNVKALISLTESGSTALWMSRINSKLPIYALTRNESTRGLMTLCRGVEPVYFDSTSMRKKDVNPEAVQVLVDKQVVATGDLVILTSGDHMGMHGGTNKMKVLEVGKVI